jgi:hypothetical protein
MTSPASPKANAPTLSDPSLLTPSEIASLRADKQDLHRRLDETREARMAARVATKAAAKVAAE